MEKTKNFIKKLIGDFLNIYQEEKGLRDSFGEEYADRFPVVDPKTGKKKVSFAKLFTRIWMILFFLLGIFFFIRILINDESMWLHRIIWK